LNLCKVEKNFDLLPNFWYIKFLKKVQSFSDTLYI